MSNTMTKHCTWLNKIDRETTSINEQLTREILQKLLKTKGIRIAMASTILRFKNLHIYRILAQRIYRFITVEESKLKSNKEKDIDAQIDKYLEYLKKLKKISREKNIPFEQSDRILYVMDKIINKNKKIQY